MSVDLMSAVADPTRRQLLDVLLDEGEGTATTLASKVPVSRQAVSKHLIVLDEAGLVRSRKEGKEVRFQIVPKKMNEAAREMAKLADLWDLRLNSIKRIAEAAARRKEGK
jgi:DNA-binding transcriptional ArsR family regulator